MICSKCGKNIPEKSTFCEHCGANVDKEFDREAAQKTESEKLQADIAEPDKHEENPEKFFCVYCGTELPEGADFCFKCGKQIKSAEIVNFQKNAGFKKKEVSSRFQSTSGRITEKLDKNRTLTKWGFKACGVISLAALFLPIVDYGFYMMSSIDLVKMLKEASEYSNDLTVAVLAIVAIIVHVAFSSTLIACSDIKLLKEMAIAGTIFLICVRLLPNIIIGISLGGVPGLGFSLIQYGFGWWFMFLPFAASAMAAWLLYKKEKNNNAM